MEVNVRAAIILNGRVINITETSDPYFTVDGHQVVFSEQAQIGHIYNGVQFKPPQVSESDLRAHVAMRRWRRQTAGCLWRGQVVSTDDATRAAVSQAVQSIDLGLMAPPVPWKLPSGFVALSRADFIELASAMAAHVQAQFDIEAAALVQIAAGDLSSRERVDALFGIE